MFYGSMGVIQKGERRGGLEWLDGTVGGHDKYTQPQILHFEL